MSDINFDQLGEQAKEWFFNQFWSMDTLFEIIVIFISFALATFLLKKVRPNIIARINNYDMPFRAKQVLKNLSKLILPITALFLIFVSTLILSSAFIGFTTDLGEITLKLLVAWIFIRLSLQIIENSFIRNIFAFVIWGIAALSIFGILEEATNTLDSIGFDMGEFRITALSVIKGIFLIFVLLYLAIFASSFVERRVFQIKSLTRSTQVLLAKIIRVCLIVFALLIGVTSAGIDLSVFAIFGGAVGLGIGFGLQKGISNLFSGMLLLTDRSIKPGDVIELPEMGTFGWVNNMAARYTEIVTRDNKSFLIPNEDFITQRVVNWSHGNSLIRLEVFFGVHYESDPHVVKKVAEEAAASPSRVVEDPKPVCWLKEFGDSSLNFTLRFWIKDAEAGVTNIRGAVMMALWDAFKENNIRIPYPHREVYLHNEQKKDEKKAS